MISATDHQNNYRELILDYPRDALAFFAPEVAPAPGDSARITPIRQDRLKERLGDRFLGLDAPLLVELANGKRYNVLFNLEEKTHPGRSCLYPPHRYALDFAEIYETNSVVPVVIFLRATGPVPKALVLGGDRRTFMGFAPLICQLRERPAEQWQNSDNLVARINLPNMRIR